MSLYRELVKKKLGKVSNSIMSRDSSSLTRIDTRFKLMVLMVVQEVGFCFFLFF